MMRLSARERILVIVASSLLGFLIFWYGLLNPLLLTTDKDLTEIKVIQAQLEQAKTLPATGQTVVPPPELTVLDQEMQASRVVNFLSQRLDQLGIKLIGVRPLAAANRLTVDLQFLCTYHQLLGFVNALPDSQTLLVIDEITVATGGRDNRLNVNARLLSAYR